VHISRDAHVVLLAEARRSRDGLETGGICLGSTTDETPCIFDVRVAGTSGSGAQRGRSSFTRDLAHSRVLADNAFERDRSVWIGEWHTHPRGPKRPSQVDMATYRQLLSDPKLGFHVFLSLILTPHWWYAWEAPTITAWAILSGHELTRAAIPVTTRVGKTR
jgi:integrative and conjugative element protein (TIGR02256 family)